MGEINMAEIKIDYAALKKGGFMKQIQKGYGSLRLQVIGGNLTAENIKTIAEVAEKYGHGYVHMTSRQGVEIPFIKAEELEEVKAELAKGGVKPGVCEKVCRQEAIKLVDGKIVLDDSKCNYCGRCVKSCPTDAWEGKSGYIVSFGGTFGNAIYKGDEFVPFIEDKETLFRVTDAAIDYSQDNAKPSERLRKTLERLGEDGLKEKLEIAYKG